MRTAKSELVVLRGGIKLVSSSIMREDVRADCHTQEG